MIIKTLFVCIALATLCDQIYCDQSETIYSTSEKNTTVKLENRFLAHVPENCNNGEHYIRNKCRPTFHQ